MARIIEQKQMKDFMSLYTKLVERCFDSCAKDFTSKALTTKEVSHRPSNSAPTHSLTFSSVLLRGTAGLRRELHI